MASGVERESHASRLVRSLYRARRRLRRSAVDYFRGGGSDGIAFSALLLTVPLIAVSTVSVPPWCPPSALVLPVLVGGVLLRPSSLVLLYGAVAGALAVESALMGPWQDASNGSGGRVTPGSLLVVGSVGCGGLMIAQFRGRVGVPWMRGGTMLFDLRERIKVQSQLPQLPEGWYAEMGLRPAGGQSFSGDFVVASRTSGGRTLEAVLTDVSGKGTDAGSRSLMLAGAFSGLLGSLPPHEFLPAANGYLLRQEWEEGFATSVHLVLDLDTGEYEVLSAGHPPVMHLIAGAGRWEAKAAEGPLLGIYEGAKFEGVRGTMRSGQKQMCCATRR